MKRRHEHDERDTPPTPARADPPEHPLIGLQRQAGNQSVTAAIQRTLEVTGSDRDVASMLGMLRRPSGLDLVHHRKTHQVTIEGRKDKPPSPALAAKLTEVIEDPARVAKVNLGRKQEGVGFGEFPTDEQNPVQELRIDHFEALEKGVPGAGTATLAHEITENYAATDQEVHDAGWEFAHSRVHPGAEAEANQVLEELQLSRGDKPSGRRQTQYTFTSGKGPTERTTWAEARENQYHLWDVGPGGTITHARTAPIVRLAEFSLELSALWKVLPTTAAPVVARIAELITANPSASVTLRGYTRTGQQATADEWYWAVQSEVAEIVGDSILASAQRYAFEPVLAGDNHVVITVNRPGP
ncbi:hypothetical protein SAMN04515671_2169 [Nakamurella panacisegetis]|uniref:Uncharacterized protein n=1 Tax=Nakamurella panacisegetis TaxID=1090615 RepID=A0A1H0N2C9_9ACTN|nr:hypothetical protein [Nakamurella panacisegetis]SDO86676.1 hypothetical protein SAMN04515671_2169 [Nakamurella panacisegetis]